LRQHLQSLPVADPHARGQARRSSAADANLCLRSGPGIQSRSICHKRNSLIDIDCNLSAGPHLTRVSRARISIRICTDTKINAVVKSLGLLIAKQNVR
jgi:hypothetical protein